MSLHYEGEVTIEQPLPRVHSFITDPEQVGPCLPDLHELEVKDGQTFDAVVRIGVGPVRGPFNLSVSLDGADSQSQAAMSLHGQGLGSALDLTSSMTLVSAEDGAATRLDWEAEGAVSGPLASIGGRLLDGQARQVAEELFENIQNALENPEAQTAAGEPA